MTIIEIIALNNGAHRNQTGNISVVPDGWAVLPEEMEKLNIVFSLVKQDAEVKPFSKAA